MNDTLRKLLSSRDAAWAKVQALSKTANTRSLTTAEDAEYRRQLADTERLSEAVEAEERKIRQEAVMGSASANPGDNDQIGAAGRTDRDYRLPPGKPWAEHVRSQGWDHDPHTGVPDEYGTPRSLDLGKYLRGIVTGRWDDADAERRRMLEGTGSAGGYLVPTELAGKIIDKARNVAAVLSAGAQIVPMGSRTVDVPKWNADPVPTWRAEAAPITESEAALGRVRLTARSLASLTRVTRELIEDAPNLEAALIDALATQFALSIDLAALVGNGTAVNPDAAPVSATDGPVGVFNTVGVTKTSAVAALSHDQILDAVSRLATANETTTGVIVNPGPARVLDGLKDTNGRYLDPPASIASLPRYVTNQAPAANTFVGDWSQLAVGVRTGFNLSILSERFADTGQIGIIGWWRGDIAVCRPSAFEVLIKT